MKDKPYKPPTNEQYHAWIGRVLWRGMCILLLVQGIRGLLGGIFRDFDREGAGTLGLWWHYTEHFVFGPVAVVFAVLGWLALNKDARHGASR